MRESAYLANLFLTAVKAATRCLMCCHVRLSPAHTGDSHGTLPPSMKNCSDPQCSFLLASSLPPNCLQCRCVSCCVPASRCHCHLPPRLPTKEEQGKDVPFILHNLLDAVSHARIEVLARNRRLALDLPASGTSEHAILFQRTSNDPHSRLDHIQRVHDQNLRHSSHCTCSELVYEGERLVRRHLCGLLAGNRSERSDAMVC